MTSESPQGSIIGKWMPFVPLVGSALAYAMTFVHEVAFCNVFHIPIELISLNWTTIIFSLAAGAFGLFLVGWLYVSIFLAPKHSKLSLGSVGRRFYILFIYFCVLFLVSIKLTLNEALLGFYTWLAICVSAFVIPLFDKEARLKEASTNGIHAKK